MYFYSPEFLQHFTFWHQEKLERVVCDECWNYFAPSTDDHRGHQLGEERVDYWRCLNRWRFDFTQTFFNDLQHLWRHWWCRPHPQIVCCFNMFCYILLARYSPLNSDGAFSYGASLPQLKTRRNAAGWNLKLPNCVRTQLPYHPTTLLSLACLKSIGETEEAIWNWT